MVPHGAGEQDSVHATPLLVASLATVAVIGRVPPASTLFVSAVTETVTPGTVIVPELEIVGLATEVAVNVTVRPAGGVLGGAV
jgi:hypothetical protein